MQTIYTFHANLFSLPATIDSTESIELRGIELQRLLGTAGGSPIFEQGLTVTWDEAARALEAMHRMIFEPDGSWVWSGNDAAGERWQVDGQFTEVGSFLHHVECHGRCPQSEFDQLLSALGWPAGKFAFELVQEGVTIGEDDFRRWAPANGWAPANE